MDAFLKEPVKSGRLTIIDPDGTRHVLKGAGPGPEATIRIASHKLLRRMAVLPDLYLGEGYMDGAVTIEEGTLHDLLDFCALNLMPRATRASMATTPGVAHQVNVVGRAQENVAHHYDLNRSLFELFLDEDLQYSCAYFASPDDSLEQAQENKKKRLAAKLLLEPGMRVLDIGSGFGGLAMHLARTHGVEVTGVTLSREQVEVSRARAKAAGLDGRVTFKLQDYREEPGRYDRIVSVGMFEHVGRGHYDEFFAKISSLLSDEGVCLLHSIGRMAPPGLSVTWINKYIFPGGYTPSLSETAAAVERAELWITDAEILRLHYAETLKEWNRRFQLSREKAKALYDERFCRMWEFYLQLCEIAFRRLGWMVFQLQLSKTVDAVPMTREYLRNWRG
ncbi:MAG: class I SAM-dependent methyltransferase [Hyphomicrobiales bacterium]